MIASVLGSISDFMYTYVLVALLIGVGLYFFVFTRALPLRMFGEALRVVMEPPKRRRRLVLRALMVSTASRVGVGNIAGVATAVTAGGAGAVFWMWVIATIGGASAFIESTLAQIYKKRGPHHSYGGPAYYIQTALKQNWLAYLFAVMLILTYMAASTCSLLSTCRHVHAVLLGERVDSLGRRRRPCGPDGRLNPGRHSTPDRRDRLPRPDHGDHLPGCGRGRHCLQLPQYPRDVLRDLLGCLRLQGDFRWFRRLCMMLGIKRGLYSNEAGVGSAPNAAASASVSHPAKQGLVQMLSVFIDTMVSARSPRSWFSPRAWATTAA